MLLSTNYLFEAITMKHSISMRNILTDIALAGAFSLTLIAAQALASFVDYDHSPEGVHHSASVYTGTPMKNRGFIDHDHSAEGVASGHMGTSGSKAPGMCGFIDCDHSSSGIKPEYAFPSLQLSTLDAHHMAG